jgi:hypothetical protein
MASSWKVLLFSVAALAGLASAASPVWNGPTIPTAVEVNPMFSGTVAPFTESTPVLFIYIGAQGYTATLNNDKAKQWAELAKTAFATGKKLNINYDPDVFESLKFCVDFDASNKCIVATTFVGSYRSIKDLSLQ